MSREEILCLITIKVYNMYKILQNDDCQSTIYLNFIYKDLRRKYAGAVPLGEQEKFSEIMVRLQENQRTMEENLKKVCLKFMRF